MIQTVTFSAPFILESGEKIPKLTVAYQTFGTLNASKTNVVWVFHALTANTDVATWWPGLVGENCLLNPQEYFIICANVLGSPYGSTAPQNLSFPNFTVRDVVNAHVQLAAHLSINHIFLAIGGSFGGSQALEFAYAYPGTIVQMVLVACAATESAWGQAIHQAQRLALQADSTFGQSDGGKKGLKAARGMAMLQYRTAEAYMEQQTDEREKNDDYKACSYISYQGDKLVERFTALSFYYLGKCLDTHHIGRGRGGEIIALGKIKIPTLAIAIDTDGLVPPELTRKMAVDLPNAVFATITSEYGHDGFLVETTKLSELISCFIT